ncbi:unknown [Roseburia sp. CAG:380]|nr:unknown [Roseburia sp. CAG:380]
MLQVQFQVLSKKCLCENHLLWYDIKSILSPKEETQ